MPESTVTDQTDELVRNSRKREVAATVTTLVVTVALGVAASGLIEKLGKKVHDRIAPPAKDEN